MSDRPLNRKSQRGTPPVADAFYNLMPPHSLMAERSVLGGLMIQTEAWERVGDLVSGADFYLHGHRLIFDAIAQLALRNQPTDLVSVSESLSQKGQLEAVGGFATLAELVRDTPSAGNVAAWALIVADHALRRGLLSAGQEIATSVHATEGANDTDTLIQSAEMRLQALSEQRHNRKQVGPEPVHQILKKSVARIEALYANPSGGITGVSSGFPALDRETCGLQPGDLVIIAARPSMGKTTFAMNICEAAALGTEARELDKPVAIFSLEMPSDQLMLRSLASLSRVSQQTLRTGTLADDDWARLSSSLALLAEANLFIDDSSGLTPAELRTRARRIAKDHNGLSLIMIDYLQLMRVPEAAENRTQEVSEISRSLKALAKEMRCPVIALSQLNRALENRADKRPVNADLRESGAIEQDADLILFLYRDEYYNKDSNERGLAEVIIGKQRNGPVGSIKLAFNGLYARFDDLGGAA